MIHSKTTYKSIIKSSAITGLCFGLFACSADQNSEASSAIDSPQRGYNQEKSSQLASEARNSASQAQATIQDKYEDLETKLEKLGDKIERSSGEAKADLKDKYDDLTNRQSTLGEQINELTEYSGDQWDSAKANIEDGLTSLEGEIDKATN